MDITDFGVIPVEQGNDGIMSTDMGLVILE